MGTGTNPFFSNPQVILGKDPVDTAGQDDSRERGDDKMKTIAKGAVVFILAYALWRTFPVKY